MRVYMWCVVLYLTSVAVINAQREEPIPCTDSTQKCVNYKHCPEVIRMLQADNDYDVKQAQLRWCSSNGPTSPKVCCQEPSDLKLPTHSSLSSALPVADCGFSNVNMLNRSAKVYLDSLGIYNRRSCYGKDIPPNRFKVRVKRMGGGRQSRIGQWPWLVMIMNKFRDFETGYLDTRAVACMGAIINDLFILTIGSCVYHINSPTDKPFLIYAGLYDLDNRGKFKNPDFKILEQSRQAVNGFMFDEGDAPQEIHIDQVFHHPQMKLYDKKDNSTIGHNIALVKLKKRLQFNKMVQPICLPTPEADDILHAAPNQFRHLTAASYGLTERYRSSPYRFRWNLRHAHIPIVDNKLCDFYDKRSELVYCVGGLKDPTMCSGDEGAPLMASSEDGRMHLIALLLQEYTYTQRKYGCYIDRKPSLYINVKEHMHFIRSILDEHYTAP